MNLPCRLAFTLTAALCMLPIAAAQSTLAQIQRITPETRQNPGTTYFHSQDLAGLDSGLSSELGAAMPQPVETCFMMREYHFSRESKTSDALKLDGSSTCQTAKSFQLKNAEAQGAVLQR